MSTPVGRLANVGCSASDGQQRAIEAHLDTADLPPLTGAQIDLELAFQAEVIAPREARALLRPTDPAHPPL